MAHRRSTELGYGSEGFILCTLVLIPSLWLYHWNERHLAANLRDVRVARSRVQDVSARPLDPSLEGHLVCVRGRLSTRERVEDPTYHVTVPGAVRVRRVVEMYQWIESSHTERRRHDGRETQVTTYSYAMGWSPTGHPSRDFHEAGHDNPPMTLEGDHWTGIASTLGGRTIPHEVLEHWPSSQFSPVAPPSEVSALATHRAPVQRMPWSVYLGANPAVPVVGDYRVRWDATLAADATVLGGQADDWVQGWAAPSGEGWEARLKPGLHTASAMIDGVETEARSLAWFLRAVASFGVVLAWLVAVVGTRRRRSILGLVEIPRRVITAGIVALACFAASSGMLFDRPLAAVAVGAGGVALLAWAALRTAAGM